MVQTPNTEETTPKRKLCIACKQEFSGDEITCPNDGTTLTSLTMETSVGSTIGDKYEILAVIGGGAMGLVYKARHTLMKRVVAVKMLHPNMLPDAGTVKRFQKEAEALSCLNHPNILTVFDFGVSTQGQPYLVTDYLEGQTLGELLEQNQRLEWPRTLSIFLQVCGALSHAHKNGVIHRDIKPSNIMLTEFEEHTDFVKILDFGIAKVMTEHTEDSSQLTRTGEVFGSPLYMSPEQCRGKPLDARSDIYSLGCVIYRTLTGQPAFFGQDLVECLYKHVNEDAPLMTEVCPEAEIPPELQRVVLTCLKKDPLERYQTMVELKEALAQAGGIPFTQSGVMSVSDPLVQSGILPLVPNPSEAAASGTLSPARPFNTLTPPSLPPSTDLSKGLEDTDPDSMKRSGTGFGASAPPLPTGIAGDKRALIGIVAGACLLVLIVVVPVVAFLSQNKSESTSTTGTGNPQTATSASKDPFDNYMAQGKLEYESGEYAEAQAQFKKAISEAQKRHLPQDKITQALHYMITASVEAGQFTEAEAFVSELEFEAKVNRKSGVPTSIPMAEAYFDRATLLIKSTNPKDRATAKKLLNLALKYFESKPEANADEMRTVAKLGQLDLMEGQIDPAKKMMEHAVGIAESDPRVSQLELALRMEQLGDTYVLLANNMKNGDKYYDDAEQLYFRALQLRITSLKSDDHPALAQSYKRIGIMYFLRDDYDKALKELNKALEIRKKQDKPYQLAEIERAISYVYLKQKNFSQADSMFQQAIATANKAGASAQAEVGKWQAGYNSLKKACGGK